MSESIRSRSLPTTESNHVHLLELFYAEYPYDSFLLIRLPGSRAMVYRMQSDDFLIWEGEIPYDARPDTFLFPLIDAVCRERLTRVDAGRVRQP
jgi:hypothetical protein